MKESNPRVRHTLWAVLIVAVFGMTVLFAYRSLMETQRNAHASLPVYHSVADFNLTERSGKPLKKDDLLGKVWVADFIFTSCMGPCPLLSSRVAELQQMLAPAKDVRIVSFSVDPETDTVPVLANYANRFRADPAKWLFVTGEEKTIHTLIAKSFLLPITRNPDEAIPDGKFIHSTKLVLVDTQGRIRGIYDGLNPETLPRILKDIGTLLKEAGI